MTTVTARVAQRRAMLFVWLTPALLAGAKTCIRVEWDERDVMAYRPGDLVEVFDHSPRNGGRAIATVRIVGEPALQPMREMPSTDYEAEGWAWMHKHPKAAPSRVFGKKNQRQAFSRARFDEWSRQPYSRWVVRFRLVRVLEA